VTARESDELEHSWHMPVADTDPIYSHDILQGYGLDRIGVGIRKRRSVP
jgi:hypothetical protein